MKYEQAVLEILKSLIIADKIPDFNRGSHTSNLIEQAFEIADEFSKKLNEKLAKQSAGTPAPK